MPFGEIGVCGGELVGGAFAVLLWGEGGVIGTRWHFDMEDGCGTDSAAQACSGWAGTALEYSGQAGTGGREESVGHL